MKKKSIFLLFLILIFPTFVFAESSMVVTPISTGVNGDAVLLESNGEYLLMDTLVYDSDDTKELVDYLIQRNITTLSVYIIFIFIKRKVGISLRLFTHR